MDQRSQKSPKKPGLRLIKGATEKDAAATKAPVSGNRLVLQLSALADALDQEVALILSDKKYP